MQEQSNLNDLALQLASAKKPCLSTPGTLEQGHPHLPRPLEGYPQPSCADCEGTGEVYVLGLEVRVECLCFDKANNGLCRACVRSSKGKEFIEHAHDCLRCNGRGYTALDPEKLGRWMKAFTKAGFYVGISWHDDQFQSIVGGPHSDAFVHDADDPEEAWFLPATKALG